MGQSPFDFQPQRKVYTVSELSEEIRAIFDDTFPDLWVEGEVSNFRPAGSGHLYFTLKDAKAQLRVVCFRSQARYLKFKPADGVAVIARGRLSVYEARGEYQLIVEVLEPAGLGALQLAFEQLKAKLAAEGLFDPARKKPLPMLPSTIGVVTSPTGAVIRDILRVLRRRFRNRNVALYPVRVQGEGAAIEIAEALRYFSRPQCVHPADVIILARGGGSIEDLWPFNEEAVARAIAASAVPVISGVGHETDFTIADFVADLRAPTPSAAAEMVVRARQDLAGEVEARLRHAAQLFRLKLAEARSRLSELRMHRVFQTLAMRVAERAERVDEAVARIDRSVQEKLNRSRHASIEASSGVVRYDVARLVGIKRAVLADREQRLDAELGRYVTERRSRLAHARAMLSERNPSAILARGYSITRDALGRVVRDAATVPVESEISVRVARGELQSTVTRVTREASEES